MLFYNTRHKTQLIVHNFQVYFYALLRLQVILLYCSDIVLLGFLLALQNYVHNVSRQVLLSSLTLLLERLYNMQQLRILS